MTQEQPAPGPEEILGRLAAYRANDAPTHGGRVLSYVYDSGRPWLDALAADAARAVQPVNGLDPTTFPSVALLEGDLVAFAREMLHGPGATGSVTSGGTESCLLAVKAARDRWRSRHPDGATPELVLPTSAHAAFVKAAHYLGLRVRAVPVDPTTGVPAAQELVDALGAQTALVVVSAPSYPHGVLDPVAQVAAAAAERDVPCHVDACVGGLVLPWWEAAGGGTLPAWDLGVPGVSSISADLHKYGFTPKGASLLLFAQEAQELDRARYFALTDWPGYPVVNPTVLGSRSATSLAAAWAVVTALGREGYIELAQRTVAATASVHDLIDQVDGLRVLGTPAGPLLAVVTDQDVPLQRRVDPHLWAAAAAAHGIVLQAQPGMVQHDGTRIARSTHLTVTPVTDDLLPELREVLPAAAEQVRGREPDGIPPEQAEPDPAALAQAARESGELDLTGVLELIEALPRERSAAMLTDFLAEFSAPRG